MANCSIAHGTYTLDFTKTDIAGKQNAQAKKQFLQNLNKVIGIEADGYLRTYFTELLDIENVDGEDDVITLPFNGVGRWSYTRNLSWFTNPNNEEYQVLASVNQLCVTVEYKEMEGECFTQEECEILVDGEQVAIETLLWVQQEMTPELAVKHEFYDSEEDYKIYMS